MKKILILIVLTVLLFPVFGQDMQSENIADAQFSIMAGAGLPTYGGIQYYQGFGMFDNFLNGISFEVYGGTFWNWPYATASDYSGALIDDYNWINPKDITDTPFNFNKGITKAFGVGSSLYWYTLDLDGMKIPFATFFNLYGGRTMNTEKDQYSFFSGYSGVRAEAFLPDFPVVPYAELALALSPHGETETIVSETGINYMYDLFNVDSEFDLIGRSFRWPYSGLSLSLGAKYILPMDTIMAMIPDKEESEEVAEEKDYPELREYTAISVAGPMPTFIGYSISSDRTQVDIYAGTDWSAQNRTTVVDQVKTWWNAYKDQSQQSAMMGFDVFYEIFEVNDLGDAFHMPIMVGFGADFGWALGIPGGMYLDAKALVRTEFDIASVPYLIPYVDLGIGFGLGIVGIGDNPTLGADSGLGLNAFVPYTAQIGVKIPIGTPSEKKETKADAPAEPERKLAGVFELPEWLVGSGWHRNPTSMTSQMWSFHFKGKSIKYQSNWKEDTRAAATYKEENLVEILTNTDTEYVVKVKDENGAEETLSFRLSEEVPEAFADSIVSIASMGPYLIVNDELVYGAVGSN